MMTEFSFWGERIWYEDDDVLRFTGYLQISQTLCVSCCSRYKRGPTLKWPALLVPSGAPQEMLLRALHTSPQPERWRDTIWTHFLTIITDINATHRALMNRVFPYSGVLLHDVPAEGGVLRFVGDLSGSSTGWPASRTPGRSLCPPTSAAQSQQRKSSLKIPEVTRTVPTQTPKEDFYNMIVNSQVSAAETLFSTAGTHTYDLACNCVRKLFFLFRASLNTGVLKLVDAKGPKHDDPLMRDPVPNILHRQLYMCKKTQLNCVTKIVNMILDFFFYK